MTIKQLRRSMIFSAIMLILIGLVLSSSTYAWFSFNNSTNVEPVRGKISGSGSELLISASPEGPFKAECELMQEEFAGVLEPVSTYDLIDFYASSMQNRDGYSIQFVNVSDRIDSCTIHGSLYLTARQDGCYVAFYPKDLDFGTDNQALAAMRLGLKIKSEDYEYTYIFKLDDMGNTANAEKRNTVIKADSVVGMADGETYALYDDRSVPISRYFSRGGENNPQQGEEILCYILPDEIVEVEYWLYLEGCDENCINAVQSRDVALQLSFAAVELHGNPNAGDN